jgi:MFS family permease
MTVIQQARQLLLAPMNDDDRARQRGLRLFAGDGFFSSLAAAFNYAYLVPFMVTLGATNTQVSTWYFLANGIGAFALYPGALIDQRLGRRWRKELVVATTGLYQVLFLAIAFVPIFLSGQNAVWGVIGVCTLSFIPSNLGIPAWSALIADLVPAERRGRYMAARSNITTLAGLLGGPLAGFMIQQRGGVLGYRFAFIVAFGFAIAQLTCYYLIPALAISEKPGEDKTKADLSTISLMRQMPAFLALCSHTLVYTMATYFAAPLFTPYLMNKLHATVSMVGVLAYLPTLPVLLCYPLFGQLADRWGNKRVLLLTSLFAPVTPLAYVFVQAPWQIMPVNILMGVAAAGYGLARFNMMLELSPEPLRARLAALHQMAFYASVSLGSLLGGPFADHFGYVPTFVISATGMLFSIAVIYLFIPGAQRTHPALASMKTEI